MFLDTSIIIDMFLSGKDSERFDAIYDCIKDEPIIISVIQLAEISDWCLNNDIAPSEAVSKVKDIVEILPLNERILLDGSRIKYGMRSGGVKKFSLMDGIILASALSVNEKLLTSDSDFRKAEHAVILK